MSLVDIVTLLQQMGEELRANAADAEVATAKTRDYNKAVAEGQHADSGMSANQGGSGVGVGLGSTSTTSLGDPRNGADSAMRMNAAIEAAKRR